MAKDALVTYSLRDPVFLNVILTDKKPLYGVLLLTKDSFSSTNKLETTSLNLLC